MNKGQDAPDKKGLSLGLQKHHKVLKPRGHTMHQYRTLGYRSPQGGVFEGSLGQAKYMQIGLPGPTHGNPTGIHYTYFFGQGRNCQQSFSGFKV